MKTVRKIWIAVLALGLVVHMAQAQNYKAAKIDASGKITNEKGQLMGTVTKDGTISDASGVKVAYVDSEGNMVDAKTGAKIGKPDKNGMVMPHFAETPDKGWSISSPMNGTCTVKDADGKVTAEVHESYKKFGACAIHCLSNQKTHMHH